MDKLEGIKAYPGNPAYSVSKYGEVWGPRGWKLKPSRRKSSEPYLGVTLTNPRQNKFVHAMVAEAFIGPCPPGKQIAHQNGDGSDNRLENLSYMTCRENILQKDEHGTLLRGERHSRSKLKADNIHEIRRSGLSNSELAERFGVAKDTVRDVRSGRTWAHLERIP